jgi:hypothetical protein
MILLIYGTVFHGGAKTMISHLLTSGCQILSLLTIDCIHIGIVAFAVEYLSSRIKSHSCIVGSILCQTTEKGLKMNNLITKTTHTIRMINVAKSSVSISHLTSRLFWFMYVRCLGVKKDSFLCCQNYEYFIVNYYTFLYSTR